MSASLSLSVKNRESMGTPKIISLRSESLARERSAKLEYSDTSAKELAFGRRSGIVTFSSLVNSLRAFSALLLQFADEFTARLQHSGLFSMSPIFVI